MGRKKISQNFTTFYGVILFTVLIVFSSCQSNTSALISPSLEGNLNEVEFSEKPKNIILMIGDGMGLSQVSAALYSSKKGLHLEDFQHIGFHKSYAKDDLITDSAAGATAFACGIKTYNGAIGVNHDTIPQKTILEIAEDNGLATGLIATASIAHATPAAFYAHQPIRVFHEQIAADLLETDVDLIIGGGKKYFDRRSLDERDLYQELKDKNYHVSNFLEMEITEINFHTKHKIAYFTADRHPFPVNAGRNYLPFASRFGPRFLKRYNEDKGFFLMIEGSQIDWAGHGNEGNLMIKETLDFDRAIGEAIAFAKADKNTLVIVTADHECGGLAINPGSEQGLIETAFTTNGHTGALVPVYAYGPGAEQFKGIYENTAIYHKMFNLFITNPKH